MNASLAGTFYKLGLIGYPLGHSMSPVIHQWLLDKTGMSGQYDLLPCAPDDLDKHLAQLRQSGYHGWNVTIPHKEAMASRVNRLSEQAKRLQAVNTVQVEADGSLTGHNTDWIGFWQDLPVSVQQAVPGKSAVVLGAGGSARAVLAALAWHGVPAITLLVRSPRKAQGVVDWFRAEFAGIAIECWSLTDGDAVQQALTSCGLLVNTTPVGLWPDDAESPLSEAELTGLPPDCFVYDLIYKPARTRLTTLATQRGLSAQTGLGMLIRQAVAAFELWTGQPVAPQWIPILQAHVTTQQEPA